MKKGITCLAILLVLVLKAQQRPKLVVGIVVDQMKTEYLDRFYDDYSDNGFKRLMQQGYTFYNMNYNYMPTYTAPGHASIFTGTTPAIHGIVGNEWFNKATGKNLYCTDDEAVASLVKGSEKEGKMSPKNLLATTVTDELRLATNFKGKVIGLSIKDRGAILPAGHFANWAFWYSNTGDFISSTFYGRDMPEWVVKFNAAQHYLPYIQKGWSLLKPAKDYNESLADDNPYEGKIDKSKPPVFSYDLKSLYQESGAGILRTTPYGNDILADLALKAIEMEGLGKDDITDFLTVSFSSTDYIGHTFGTRAMETQDTYLRLDLTLGKLLDYLDAKVGKGNYLLFLTADHAAAENSVFLRDQKYNVSNIPTKEIKKALEEFSMATYGVNLLLNYSNYNLYFDKVALQTKGLDLTVVKQQFKTFLMTQPYVRRVYTEEEILASSGGDYTLDFIFRGFDPKQNGDLVLLHRTGYMEYNETGTTHGSPNSYDTNVPLLFYGWNVPQGESYRKEYITTIAPTLAKMLKITFPNGTEGEVLEELLIKK